MINTGAFIQEEKKDKNKARTIAIIIHSILIIGLVVPFLSSQIKEQPAYEQIVVIDFNDEFQSAAAKSSTRKASPTATKAVETPKPKPVVKPTPPKPTPKPTPPVAKHKPVIKTPEPEAPPIKTAPVKKDVPTPEPKKVEVVEAPVKVEVPEPEVVEEEIIETPVVEEVAEVETTTAPTDNTSGAPSKAGEGNFGNSKTGVAETDGKADKGDSGNDFSGDGLLTRKVVYRADVRKLTQEEGKIVINICVSQQGTVSFSEYNAGESTITNMDLIVKAKKTASKYKFEKDYSAPRKQCGKLTFIFKID